MDVKLVMFKPNGKRKDLPLTKEVMVIGRGQGCDLQVPLENVSRRHCEISISGETVKVKDLASSNGTYVNNKRVNECDLKAGDRLVVGPIVFTVQIDGVPEEITPAKPRTATAAQPAGSAGEQDEIVALEAAAGAGEEDDDLDVFAAIAEEEPEEVDPIAALEALASESRKDEDEKKE